MFLRRNFFILLIFILLLFLLFTYQGSQGGLDKSNFMFLHYPVKIIEQGISTTVKSLKGFFRSDDKERKLVEANIAKDCINCIEVKNENERLRALLELKSQTENYVATAEVFAREPSNWFHVIWIDKGARDGISKDMVALTPLGVVGRVQRVLHDRADIIQITDVNSSLAVRTQSSRIEGILGGSGNSKCYLKYVSHEAEVTIGDIVVTSGLDGIFPEGLVVGYITDVRKGEGEFFQVIEVLPTQDFKTLEEVTIVKR